MGQGSNAPQAAQWPGTPPWAPRPLPRPGGGKHPVVGYAAEGPATADVGTGGGGGTPASGHVVAGSAPATVQPVRRAGAPMSRYVATGGGASSAMPSKIEFAVSGGGSSAAGTTIASTDSGSSASSGSFPSSYSSAGAGSGGTYSIAGTAPSGGGHFDDTGRVQILGENSTVGGTASFTAVVTPTTGGTPTLSGEEWAVSGPTPAYSSMTVPDPGATPPEDEFVNTPLNTASFDGDSAISFDWGAQPGVDDVKLSSATVTINGQGAQIKPKTVPWDVALPGLKYLVKANRLVTLFRYKNGQYSFGYGNTDSKNPNDWGIYWGFETKGLAGSFAMVQIMTYGSYVYVDSNGVYHSQMAGTPSALRRSSLERLAILPKRGRKPFDRDGFAFLRHSHPCGPRGVLDATGFY